MFLEILIVFVLILFIHSLVVTSVTEVFAQLLNLRGRLLAAVLRRLLSDSTLRSHFYKEWDMYLPGLTGPETPGSVTGQSHPSKLTSAAVGRAMVRALTEPNKGAPSTTAADIRALAEQLPVNSHLRQVATQTLARVQGGVDEAETAFATWYDGLTDQLSTVYRRRAQVISVLAGIALAALFNLNFVTIAQSLVEDPTKLTALVAQAESLVEEGKDAVVASASDGNSESADTSNLLASLTDLEDKVSELDQSLSGLPVGWSSENRAATLAGPLAFLAALLSWVIAGCAAILGAPFWFDLLSMLVGRRRGVANG